MAEPASSDPGTIPVDSVRVAISEFTQDVKGGVLFEGKKKVQAGVETESDEGREERAEGNAN